jgi:DNA uptake protein ComE-like DNA-binding protein
MGIIQDTLNIKVVLPAVVGVVILVIVVIAYLIPLLSPKPDIYVDVEGAVSSLGVVLLALGSRVTDAIDAAGGLVDGADTKALNKAAVLLNGDLTTHIRCLMETKKPNNLTPSV